MHFAQKTALLAMIQGFEQQLQTFKVLLNADIADAGTTAARTHVTTRRARTDDDDRFTTPDEDEMIARRFELDKRAQKMVDHEQDVLTRMVEDARESDDAAAGTGADPKPRQG